MQKLINGSMQNVSRSGEKGGMTTRSCRHWLQVHRIMKSLISILWTARSLLAGGGTYNAVCWDTGKRAVVRLTLIQL